MLFLSALSVMMWMWQIADVFGVLDYRESSCFLRLGCLITTNAQNISPEWL